MRVLRSGGCLGVTAWGPDPTDRADQGTEADAIVSSERDAFGFPSEAPIKSAPWEEQLRSRSRLCTALASAAYNKWRPRSTTTAGHSRPRLICPAGEGSTGTSARRPGEERWREFCDSAARKIRDRLGDALVSVKRVWIAIGTGP